MNTKIASVLLLAAASAAVASAAGPEPVGINFVDRFLTFGSEQYWFAQVTVKFDKPIALRLTECEDGSDSCTVPLQKIPISLYEKATLGLANMECDGRLHTYNEPNLECSSIVDDPEQCEREHGCRFKGDWESGEGSCETGCDGPCTPMSIPPQKRDALAAVFAAEADMDDYLRNIRVEPDRLIFLFFSRMVDTNTGDVYPIGYTPIDKMREGRCRLRLKTDRIRDVATGEEAQNAPRDTRWRETPPVCDQTKLFEIVENFDRALAGLKGVRTIEGMEVARSRLMVETSKDAWFGCENIVRQSIVEGDRNVTTVSKDCVEEYGTDAFNLDPCCNYALQNEQCCAPREVTQSITALVDVDIRYVALQCSNTGTADSIKSVIDALINYVRVEAGNAHPETGCNAEFVRATGGTGNREDIWDTFTAFIDDCNEEIFGDRSTGEGKECSTDDDCYTQCQTTGTSTSDTGNCAIPYGNPAPYLQACYIDKMDEDVKGRLLRIWGVYDVSDTSAFSEKFIEKTATDRCVGPSEWLYNGGWFRNDTSGGDYGDGSGGPGDCFDCGGGHGDGDFDDGFDGYGDFGEGFDGYGDLGDDEVDDEVLSAPAKRRAARAAAAAKAKAKAAPKRRRTRPEAVAAKAARSRAEARKAASRGHRVRGKAGSETRLFKASRIGGMLAKRKADEVAKRISDDVKRAAAQHPKMQAVRRAQVVRHRNAAHRNAEHEVNNARRTRALNTESAKSERSNLIPCWGGSERDMERNGCFWVEDDAEGCVAEQQCNWGQYDADEETCSRDVMNNGGFMCGDCFGGQFCWERSRLPKCQLNDWSIHEWTEADCDAVSGTVVLDQWDPSRKSCAHSTGTIETCLDECRSETGPQPGVEFGCVNREASPTECHSFRHPEHDYNFAWVHWINTRNGRPIKLCRTHTGGEDECDEQYGSLGFAWEQITDETPFQAAERCQHNYCFNRAVASQEDCQALNWRDEGDASSGERYWYHWNPMLNNNSGLCQTWLHDWGKKWAELKSECEGIGEDWTWYQGRRYEDGSVYNEELCETGLCEHNDRLDQEECEAENFCTFGCQGCDRGWRSQRDNLCFHTNETACNDDENSGRWDSESSRCVFDVADKAECDEEGGDVFAQCVDYSKDECYGNEYQDDLQCDIQWRQCENQEECEQQGECSDWNLQREPWNHSPSEDGEAEGVCVFPKVMNEWGWLDCRVQEVRDRRHNGGGDDHAGDDFSGGDVGGGDGGDGPPRCPAGTEEYHCPDGLSLQECACFCTGSNPDSDQCCNLCPDDEECAWFGRGDEFPEDQVSFDECGGGGGDFDGPDADFNHDGAEGPAAVAPKLRRKVPFLAVKARGARVLTEVGDGGFDGFGLDGDSDSDGSGGRPEDLDWTENGCISRDIESDLDCETRGGTWMQRATDEDSCESGELRVGCCEPGRDCRHQLSAKNATECEACGGTLQPYFGWRGGQWIGGRIKPLEWIERERKPVNEWKAVVNERLVRQFLDIAVGSRIAEAYRSELKCRFSPKRNVMKTIACNCGTGLSGACAAATEEDTELADAEVFCGQAKTISASGFEVALADDSIQTCDREVSVELKQRFSNAKAGDSDAETAGRRVRRRLLSTEAEEAACYARVINGNNQVVGQLRGDCLTFTASGDVANVELCMPLKSEITHDTSAYPDAGVAIHTVDGSNEDVYTASSSSVFVSGETFCVTVSASGTYCPVSLMDGYADATSTSPADCGVSDALTSIQAAVAELTAGAEELVFTSNPTGSVAAGDSLSELTVAFRDADGNTVTAAAASVTLSIKPDTGTSGATVSGTPRVAAVDGVATFDDIQISKSGTGYVLVASAAGIVAAESEAFDIAAGDPSAVAFLVQPGGCVEGANCLQQPQAAITDLDGNTVTTSTEEISLTIDGGDDTVVATATAVAGVATFTGVQFADLDSSVRLVAASGALSTGVSQEFAVVASSGVAVSLAISAVADGEKDTSILVTVAVKDGESEDVATSSASITLDIVEGTGDENAALHGTVTTSAISGVATFAVSIDRAATGYQLIASSAGLASSTSGTFTVNGPASVVFTQQPTGANVNEALGTSPQVTIRDVNGNAYTDEEFVTLSVKAGTGAGTLRGVVRAEAENGVASFGGLIVDAAGSSYRLVAVTDGGLTVDSDVFEIVDTSAGDDDDDDDDDDADDDDDDDDDDSGSAILAVSHVLALVCALVGMVLPEALQH